MSVIVELRHLLLQVLPSPATMAQGRSLCIQNQLGMVCDSLWAINSMINIPKMQMLYNKYLQLAKELDPVFDVPVEFADWETDVAAAVMDVGDLLGRILDWEPNLHPSIVGTIQQVNFRHVILVELKEMLCNLNSLVLRGSAMGLRRDPMESMNPLQEDYSIVLKNEVVGREEDLEKLIAIIQQQQLVPSNNNGSDSDPYVIVIFGELWVGKTTLGHMIYHHTWVRQQFHHRIWVDLPFGSIFKMINIIGKEFARSIKNKEYCDQKLDLEQPLQAMWEYIKEQLDGSRYLLVLHCDDLESLMQQEWDELKNILLRVGGPGSAVLFVVQGSRLGFLNGVKNITTYCLNPLSEDAWLKLFKRHAATPIPRKQDKSEKDELFPFDKQHFQHSINQTIGAKIFGSLSHAVPKNILETFQSDFHAVPKHIYTLKYLPLFLLRLYQYHYLLDAGSDDVNNMVIHMMTAGNFLPAEGIAPRYDSLFIVSRIFYEISLQEIIYSHMKVPEDSATIPKNCRYLCLEINHGAIPFRLPTIPIGMSDKLLVLILQEQEDEETTLGVYEKRRMKAATATLKFLIKMLVRLVRLRILAVENSMIQRLPSEVSKLVNLRYLHLSKLKMELLPKSLFELLNLRILSLLRCKKLQMIPEGIRKLKKLQILKIAYCTKFQQLPKSITKLKNLEELNVEGCCWLRELPEDLVSFKSLRILDVTGCASLSQIPRGIEQLIDLRNLSGIFVGVDEGFGLSQLQALTNLQRIRLRNLERAEKTQTEVLMGQQSLGDLSLHWSGDEANESFESATPLQVLEALRPSVHLKRLEIISYNGVEFPTWTSKQQLARFDSLVEIKLIHLKRCATLPSLGQLHHLEELEISGMDLIKQIDDTFYGDGWVFRMLEKLTFSEMLALEKWFMPERINVRFFQMLKELTLIQCPKLKEIIDLPYNDQPLTMRVWLNNKTIWSAEFCNWKNLQYVTEIEIVGCQEIRCLPHGMQSLKRLTKMTIKNCVNLMTLVTLDSLVVLRIYACPMLEFNLEVFTKLSQVKIKGCPKMQM